MAELTVNGQSYMTGRLTPMQQLHVTRRILPLFTGVAPALDVDKMPGSVGDQELSAGDLRELAPFAEALAKMSDADVEAITNPCLAVVNRKNGVGWAPVMPTPGNLMFQDIGVIGIITLVWAVIQENIGNFLDGPTGGPTAQ